MSHQLTHAEVENKVAFLVQLNALLTQIGAVVSSNALGSAQKAKLSDLRTSTEAWLKDVGVVGAPRPSLATPSPPPPPAQAATPPPQHPAPEAPAETAEAAEADAPPRADAPPSTVVEAPTTAPSDEAATPKAVEDAPAAVPASAPPPAPAAPASPSSSLPAELSAALELPEGRGLVDLVAYLRQLFDSDVPERAKLQAFGKSLVRLLIVRCCSTTMASLQHVVHHTYAATAAAAAAGDASDEDSCVEAAITEPTALAKLFVVLAKEINVATKALLGCVQLVTASAVLSDAATVRFPLQLCVDVVRQTRRAQVYFQSRVEKEELYLLRTQLLSSGTALATAVAAAAATARDRDASLEDLDAAQEAALQTSPDRLAAHVRGRLKALQQLWGPSLVHAIRNIGGVVEPAVKFLASVAAVRAEGAPAPLVALKKDAAHDLFSLCGPMTAAAAANGSSNGSGLAKPPSSGDLTAAAPPAGSPASVCSATPPAWRAAAGEVLTRLGCSFSADYLAAVAGCCGDSNEGQLLATRLLTDMLQYVATHELSLLRCLLRHSRWHRPLYDGILNCLVSIQPAVLAAGLDALGLLTTACPMEVGQEVGFLYSNVVLRLLESTNSPHYVKRTIVLHFLTTFMSTTSTVDVEGGNAGAAVPLLLHLYRLYDLNVHVHQLNFAQQLTSALSRIVRAAPKEDFTQDAVVQEQLRLQQEAAAATATTAAGAAGAAGEAQRRGSGAEGGASSELSTSSTGAAVVPNLSSLSLPAMALHGLVRIVELLTTQTPPEEEGGRDVLATLPAMTCREDKLREQQAVDRFNTAPKKALLKLLDVTEAENAVPESQAGFTAQWEHTLLPPPLSAATAAKIEAAADLLIRTSSLHPEAVAEFLTTPAVFPLQVCAAYMRRLPLAGYTVLEAISELLMRVQLPKEGQRIERLLEYFSAAYYAANRGPGIDRDVFPFKSDTAVFIVVVATVMLNTNIHNPSAGMRLDLKAFRGQLRRCNEDENFADSFVDHIFDRISMRPLESIKAIAPDPAATTASGAGADGATSRGAFDIFFVSQEEKRQLAFGAERQRMVSETRQLLQLRTEQVPPAAVAAAWWCAAAKDFFLSTWSAVCAVFGPAMYEGATAAPMDVLLQCVRGLQSLLCTAAAFDLPTECTVTLLTLLRMAEATPVRAHCRRAVLVVAATTYAINFPVRCWVAVCQLVLELRRTATAAAPPLVENVFTRIEGITRLSVEAEEEGVAVAAVAANASAAASTATEGAAGPDRCTQAIHRALEGIMTTISGYAVGDVANLGAALAVLRRALEYTRIVHLKRTTDIVYFVNVRDFTDVVVPAYVELLQKHSASDEGLQVLFECLVDLLCAMWVSYSTRRVVPPSSAAAATAAPAPSPAVTVDTAPAGFAHCFECLRRVYDVTLASAGDGAATLLQMHTLQAVKEVLSRSVRAAEVTSAGQHLSLYTMVASWRAALYPLAMALCDRASTATEAASLALLVLRKLVALCGGTGGASSDRLPAPVRGALLWLLAQLAYMGGMCGDVDSAQVCVALLSSICTSTVAMAASAAGPAARGWHTTDGIASPAMAFADSSTFARLMEGRDALTQQVVASIEETPNFVVQRTLMRLCLLLRCEREQTRAEVVHQLRTLALQMRPQQLCPMALDLAEVVLEGTIGHAAHHHKTPITHPSLMPFLFFRMPVPPSMRRCSRSAFRATVPATLSFLANELLTGLTGEHLATAAESVMRRCLVPILLSPNSPYQCRFIAVRSLSQCIAVCLPQTAAAPSPRLAQCVLDCLAMALSAVQVPLPNIVSPAAGFVGRRWLDPPSPSGAAPWARYGAQAAKTVALMDTAEPQWLVRGASAAAAAAAWGLPVPPQDDGGAVAAGPAPSRSGRGGAGGSGAVGGLLADEPLIEYISLLAQILAGVPRELHGVVTSAAAAAPAEAAPPTAAGTEEDWTLPHASVRVLLQLCLQAAGTLFAVLWRINHPYEMEQYALQSVQLGREPATYTRNGGLLPHAAIRSVLQCYLELAMLCPEYPSSDLLAVTTDLIEGIRQVQVVAHPGTPGPASPTLAAGTTAAAGSGTSLAADPAALQRLPPQEQQHVRTCNSGMHQQLATVLGYLVRLLTGQPQAAATAAKVAAIDGGATAALPGVLPGWTRRQEAFEAMALHPHFFSSLVSLLTPTAGTLIVTVRDYFAWYIAHAVVPQSAVQAAGCSTSGDDAITSAAAVALEEVEVGEATGADALITVKGGGHDCNGHANGSGNGLSRADASKREQARAALAPLLKPASLGDEPARSAAPHDADVVAHAKLHNGSAAAELEEADSLL